VRFLILHSHLCTRIRTEPSPYRRYVAALVQWQPAVPGQYGQEVGLRAEVSGCENLDSAMLANRPFIVYVWYRTMRWTI
jgi:hypothetical protein